MKIEYEITDIPDNSINDDLKWFYLEGNLKIFIDNQLFFDEAWIVLIEFAKVIEVWLREIKQGNVDNLYYETMDHDEAPIFSLTSVDDDNYIPDSIWKKFEYSRPINKKGIVEEFEKFIVNLKNDLKKLRIEVEI